MKKFKRLMACLVALAVCLSVVMPGLSVSAEDPLPNLKVEEIYWAPWDHPKEGQEMAFRAKITNAGGKIPAGDTYAVNFYVDDVLVGRSENLTNKLGDGPIVWCNVPVEGVEDLKWVATEGEHVVKAVVDPEGKFGDADPNNNTKTRNMYVEKVEEDAEPTGQWIIDCTDPGIVYEAEGLWLWGDSWGDLNGTCVELGKNGDKFTYTFTGASSLRIYAQTHGHGGKGTVTLNGVNAGTIDCNGPDGNKKVVFAKSGLDKNETYTMVVSMTNAYVYFDHILFDEEDLKFDSIAELKGLMVYGQLINGFDTAVEEYDYRLSYGTTTLPPISASPVFEGCKIDITYPETVNGTAVVQVTSKDGSNVKYYKINFTVDETIESVPNLDGWLGFEKWYAYEIGQTHDSSLVVGENREFVELTTSAKDIQHDSDNLYYLFTEASGDVDFRAKITGPNRDKGWAKSGLIIRDGLATSAVYASVLVPGNRAENGIRMQSRETAGQGTHDSQRGNNNPDSSQYIPEFAPEYLEDSLWIRLVRNGNTFTSYTSADGEAWDQVDSRVLNNIPKDYVIGFGCANNDNVVASFESVSIETKGTEPEVTEPETTEPEATEPGATEPKPTEPKPIDPNGPDLQIHELLWAPWDSHVIGEEFVFRARVSNSGSALPADTPVIVNFYVDGTLVGRSENVNVNLNDWFTAYCNVIPEGRDAVKWLSTAGNHMVVATIDPENLIAEADEGNNSKDRDLNCSDPYVDDGEWIIDCTDPDIVYNAQRVHIWDGSWRDLNGTCVEFGTKGDKFSYTFTGASSIRIYSQTHGYGGQGKVTIDGQDAGIMNCNAPDGNKRLVYGKSGLDANKEHTITVECTNPYLYFDHIVLNKEDLHFESNAELRSISVSGESLNGFDPAVFEYTKVLPYGTVKVPDVSAVPAFEGANVEVIKGASVNEPVVVKVTSSDGKNTKEYSISFIVDATLDPIPGMAGWNQLNMGGYNKPGVPTYNAETGTLVMASNSGDAWGTQDSMYFVFQQVTGDMELTARVKGPTRASDWSKAGLIIRESLERGSRYAGAIVPGNKDGNGIRLVRRETSGGETFDNTVSSADYYGDYTWIRVACQGNKITSYLSPDGETWVKVKTVKLPDIPESYFVGFAVCGNGGDNAAVAEFDHVVLKDAGEDTTLSDATLKTLWVNGIRVPGFDPEVTEYTQILQPRHRPSAVPIVQFELSNEFATAKLRRDSLVPGSSTVEVTSEDGTKTVTYTINYVYTEEEEKLSYTTSWVGNTFPGLGNVQDGKWVQNFIRGMVVMPDGTCYTESEWDEAGRTHGIYKDGDVIGNKDMDIDATKVITPDGYTWAIQDGKIIKVGTDVAITDVGEPAALALANNGELMIADNDRRQVLFYDISTDNPTETWAFGEEGGMSSDTPGLVPGEVYPTRFYYLTGTGMDEKGNIYVSLNFRSMGSFIRCLTPEGELVWELESTPFVDSFDFDPTTDGRDIYGSHEHYVMDYTQEPGKEQKLVGWTVDLDRYPNDPRNYFGANFICSTWIEYVEGEKLMFSTGMFPNGMYIWRFEDEIAIPCGIIARGPQTEEDNGVLHAVPNQPNSPYIWRDLNGDGDFQTEEFVSMPYENGDFGWDVDKNGNVWRNISGKKIAQFKCSGIDEHGSPIYNLEDVQVIDLPNYWDQVRRVQYDVDTDSLYVGGYVKDDLYEGHLWGCVGRVLYRYDNISKGELTLNENYPLHLAYYHYESDNFTDQAFNMSPQSFHVEKGRLFLVYGARGPLGFSTGEMHVYDSDTLEELGCVTPGANVGGYTNVGWVDIPQAIKALQTSDGNYKVLVEEDYKSKMLLYTVTPYDGTPNEDEVEKPDSEYTVKSQAVDTAVTIDGKLNESFWTSLGTLEKQTGSEHNANVVTFGSGWDKDYLYIGAEVKDDKVFGGADSNHWDNDAIEIFIDGNNDKGGVYDEHDVQYIVAWNKDTLFSSGTGMDEGVLWKIEKTAEGYVVEMAVPWTTLKVEPTLGAKIGFDVANDDRLTEEGVRAGNLTWAGDGGNFQSTEKFGELVLADDVYVAPKATGEITIDGVIDEDAWVLDRVMKQQIGSEFDDTKTTFGLTWDDNYLYLATRTEDSRVFGTAENVHWENDAIEIFINGNNDTSGVYDYHDAQYIVSVGKDDLFCSADGRLPGVLYKMTVTETGYDMEFAIPWTTIEVEPEDGLHVGFDVAHDDRSREDGGRAGSMVWAGTGSNFQSTENFGEVILKGVVEDIPVDPTEPEATEPEATEPEATEPEATEPEATEPEATEPEATEPEATEPEATEPEATEPEATEPEATEPEATEPEATEPEATEPEATEPEATEPEETDPAQPSEPTKPADPDSPSTGDSIFFWIPVFVVTLMAAAALVWVRRRQA